MNTAKKNLSKNLLACLILVGIGSVISYKFLTYNHHIFLMDFLGISSWTAYLQNAIFNEHVFPTWGNIWAGGMPFFGIVPPGLYFVTLLASLLSGSAQYGVFVTDFLFFNLASVAMFFYLKQITKSNLGAFLGALLYLIVPVHSGSMLTIGLTDMLICYALLPLILFLFESSLDKPRNLVILFNFFIISLFLIIQIEFSFLATIFIFTPYLIFRYITKKEQFGRWLKKIFLQPLLALFIGLALIFPIAFYYTTVENKVDFSMHSQNVIEEGRKTYSFDKITDALQYKASTPQQLFEEPKYEYYTGIIVLFPIFLLILSLILFKSNPKFTLYSILAVAYTAFLFAACYSGASVFKLLVSHIPMLDEMRVAFRFYYLYIFMMPIVIAIGIKGTEILLNGKKKIALYILSIMLSVYLILDYKPYFSLYQSRAIDQDTFLPCNNISRVIEVSDLNSPEKIWTNHAQSLELCPTIVDKLKQFEISTSWLSWDLQAQNKIIMDQGGNFTSDERFDFFSAITGTNYAGIYYANALPDNVVIGKKHFDSLYESFAKNRYFSKFYDSQNSNRNYTIFKKNTPARSYEFYPMHQTHFVNRPKDTTQALDSFFEMYTNSKDKVGFLSNNAMVSSVPDLPIDKFVEKNSFFIESKIINSRGIELVVTTSNPGLYVEKHLNSRWWKLTVDGRRAEIIDTNVGLIGVPLTEGKHTIELRYEFPLLSNLKKGLLALLWLTTADILLVAYLKRSKHL